MCDMTFRRRVSDWRHRQEEKKRRREEEKERSRRARTDVKRRPAHHRHTTSLTQTQHHRYQLTPVIANHQPTPRIGRIGHTASPPPRSPAGRCPWTCPSSHSLSASRARGHPHPSHPRPPL
eukprot:1047991-Rhodomonas_salina.5